ncbi:chaperone modulatory protein CbpM [Pseudomonas panipatensis]|jgi:chaperone modulatory protein CbpM|uniref:Chaperone modulatory protein CbpM n=2 Tax=Pseudomonas panipatensis TaxID=428992 RepID=A0A1G8HDB6_9PSED|nr:chaperone modulatory protein CbpM [Pseudomonas panipatensis]SMP57641.1 chaperone modulatory protein CbpM [Pseudomonas panipatensis]
MTMAHVLLTLELDELCESARLPREVLLEIVDVGIVEPRERRGDTWLFDAAALTLVRRAARLQREFELDWPGIALAMRLLDEVEQLRAENRQLRQRLARYLED